MPLKWTICAGILLSVLKDLHKPGLAVSPILLKTSVGYAKNAEHFCAQKIARFSWVSALSPAPSRTSFHYSGAVSFLSGCHPFLDIAFAIGHR